jgi:tetratricopeptide (TPR) repeat protein
MGLIAFVLAAVVLGAGGWFAWKKFMSGPGADPAAASAVLSDATQLGQQGRYDEAIAKLQNIKPGDPQYDSALQMIGDLQQKKSKASASVDGKPAAQYYEENLAAGQAAMQAQDFIAAKKAFDNAQTVKPLPPDVKAAYDAATRQVGKLDVARQLFGERKYQQAVTALEPLLQQDPRNRSIQKMLIDAHFNLGATALQEEKLQDAIREFDLVLQADPKDELAKRSRELAQRYQGQPTDLLYKIYVKYLPLRQPAA